VREFDAAEREQIRRETLTDLIDCGLGIVFCAAAIEAVIGLLGRHFGIFAASIAIAILSGGLFIGRWTRRGVFRAL
jgi:hypothetical protein